MNAYANTISMPASGAEPSERAEFIRRTYSHLAAAILVFTGLIGLMLQTGLAESMARMISGNSYSWLIVLGAFMGVSWLANNWATSDTSPGLQYAGLGLYTLAEAVIFLPIIWIADQYYPGVIRDAGVMTLLLFAGLTATVFITRKDFSFLGPILAIGGMVALGFIVLSILFGFNLGILFSAVMILFASGAILYSTSNVLHKYRTDQHVAASLSLFASVALLFWYILRFMMAMRR
ncbi:MAG: Bax inhibitor-1 family protein [Kiritimatiellae bacterium]|jgi:FtsH-binding integral membrane protein|nr:Bax inhibitor-1 family protein [Kiritimatiellia bacterium]